MIGLGVGIDYALFILTRFREAYATPGPTFENARESVVQAIDTAGRAVLFAGSHGRDRAARDDAARRQLPLRRGDLRLDRRAARDARLADAAAGAAHDRRRPRRAAAAAGRGGAPPRQQTSAGRHTDAAATGGMWLRWSKFVQRRPWTIAIVSALVMLADRGARDRAAARLQRRLERPRRARRPTAPTSCSPKASARASTGRCWSSRRCRASNGDGAAAALDDSSARAIAATPGVVAGRPGQAQPGRRRRDDHRLPALLAAGLRDHPARRTPARQGRSRRWRRAPA